MAITVTSDVTWDQNAWEQMAYFALRPDLYWDSLATVKATKETHRGAGVIFDFVTELASAPSDLTENADITPATMGDTTLTVALGEKGNGVKTTAKLRGTSYLPVDENVANLIGYNMALSIDDVCLTAVDLGTQIRYQGGQAARNQIAAAENITAAEVALMVAKLRGQNVRPWSGMGYGGFIHPDIAYDLKEQTSGNTWRSAAQYVDAGVQKIWNNYIGQFNGVSFMETPRVTVAANASNGAGSTGTVDVYRTYIVGQDFLAKAYSKAPGYGPDPRMVVAPVTDSLRRFTGLGWYHLVGYKVFRNEALYIYEAASSIGVNT